MSLLNTIALIFSIFGTVPTLLVGNLILFGLGIFTIVKNQIKINSWVLVLLAIPVFLIILIDYSITSGFWIGLFGSMILGVFLSFSFIALVLLAVILTVKRTSRLEILSKNTRIFTVTLFLSLVLAMIFNLGDCGDASPGGFYNYIQQLLVGYNRMTDICNSTGVQPWLAYAWVFWIIFAIVLVFGIFYLYKKVFTFKKAYFIFVLVALFVIFMLAVSRFGGLFFSFF